MQFDKYFEQWSLNYKKKYRETTFAKYESETRLFKSHSFGKLELEHITNNNIQDFINDYGPTRSKATVRRISHVINACLKDAVIDGFIKENPHKRIELVYKEQLLTVFEQKKLRDEKKWLELDEYERVRDFLSFWLKSTLMKQPIYESCAIPMQVFGAITFVALKTGARYSEILGITKLDVDFNSNQLSIDKTWNYKNKDGGFRQTKNLASIRKIGVDQQTIRMLQRYLDWRKEHKPINNHEPLFCFEARQVHNSSINNYLKYLLKTCGTELITFHGLRHTHASVLLAKGIDIQGVAARLGHVDSSMVQKVYGHLLEVVREKETEKILRVL